MSFTMIFLSLLIGAVIGYEFGKYQATKKIQEFLNEIGKEMQKSAEKQKAEMERKREEAKAAFDSVARAFEFLRTTKDPRGGDTDGDTVVIADDSEERKD